MSLPGITGLGSGCGGAFLGVVRLAFAIFVLIVLCGWRSRLITKKPTTVASRGFLSKLASGATSPGGMAVRNDDHDKTHLDWQRIHYHNGKNNRSGGTGQAPFLGIFQGH